MKKQIALILFIFLSICILKAQDCTLYFPGKVGTVEKLKHFNSKNKLESTSVMTVTSSTPNSVSYSSIITQERSDRQTTANFTVQCKDGQFLIDMSSISSSFNQLPAGMKNVKIETDQLYYPQTLSVGLKLNDGGVTITMGPLKITTRLINRQVVAKESITTPAGTFDCFKITYDTDVTSINTSHFKCVEWISPNIGIVRSEVHNADDEMRSYTILDTLTQ